MVSLGNWVTLRCVPGHKGVEENKEGDKLLEQWSASEFVGPEHQISKDTWISRPGWVLLSGFCENMG